eukprot:CAMPEP_0181515284 /NCGR_PEP_ID=MMETSP1110-20121109/63487_1 /TAXON_ID=174948 /ORGANISM="Symbiodinium sp., Strain CCMP421" /LENGTH=61 /DNA_ID=CAMNT_0023645281 /DNA_START=37 /DNA_END=219 /DNA_ORIENTATION=+
MSRQDADGHRHLQISPVRRGWLRRCPNQEDLACEDDDQAEKKAKLQLDQDVSTRRTEGVGE